MYNESVMMSLGSIQHNMFVSPLQECMNGVLAAILHCEIILGWLRPWLKVTWHGLDFSFSISSVLLRWEWKINFVSWLYLDLCSIFLCVIQGQKILSLNRLWCNELLWSFTLKAYCTICQLPHGTFRNQTIAIYE